MYPRNKNPVSIKSTKGKLVMISCEGFWKSNHVWSKWKVEKEGKITDHNEAVQGWFIKQKRECQACGKIEIRMEKTTL